jgi:nucleotidyltransferase/DNA polymerase involved in DNA repair
VVIVGVRLPCLRLAAALRHDLDPDAMAFLIERTGRRRVLEAAGGAARAGVRPGMGLREATRLVPRALVALDDPVRAALAWRRVLDRLAVLPRAVEDGGPGLAFLTVPDAERPERWFTRVREKLLPFGLAARCGAAPNRFVAFVATHRAADAVCPRGGEAAFVADAPLELLRIEDDVLLRLRLLGVRTLGDLAALPLPLLRRFSDDAQDWHDLASGHATAAPARHLALVGG